MHDTCQSTARPRGWSEQAVHASSANKGSSVAWWRSGKDTIIIGRFYAVRQLGEQILLVTFSTIARQTPTKRLNNNVDKLQDLLRSLDVLKRRRTQHLSSFSPEHDDTMAGVFM